MDFFIFFLLFCTSISIFSENLVVYFDVFKHFSIETVDINYGIYFVILHLLSIFSGNLDTNFDWTNNQKTSNYCPQGRRNIFQHGQDQSCSSSCPVWSTDGAAIGIRTKVINFCLFTFNDNKIRQICFLMYDFFIFFIIMLYYIFFLWNSCSILLIYSNMLVDEWFLLSTISTIDSSSWS